MIRKSLVLAAALAAAVPMLAAPLAAQQAVIFGEEPKLDAMRLALKADVLVLRDSLAIVEATSARLVRAKIGHSPSVVLSSARVLQTDCTRAARATAAMRKNMALVGTNDARGKAVIADYTNGLVELERAMQSCDKQLQSRLATVSEEQDPLFRVALASAEALKKYDFKLHTLLKTLQIPVDPKGFRSAINL